MKPILASILLLPAAAAAHPAPPAAGVSGGVLRLAAGGDRPSISPARAAQKARQQYGGKVLGVSLEHVGKRAYYRVKLLDHGSVRIVRIPAD